MYPFLSSELFTLSAESLSFYTKGLYPFGMRNKPNYVEVPGSSSAA